MRQLVDRRALLVGAAVATLPLPLAANGPALSADTVATCHRIRGFYQEHVRLLSAEAALEDDTPEHVRACAATDAAWRNFNAFTAQTLKQPVRSWDDVVIRAELVRTGEDFAPGEPRVLRALLSAIDQVSGIRRGRYDV